MSIKPTCKRNRQDYINLYTVPNLEYSQNYIRCNDLYTVQYLKKTQNSIKFHNMEANLQYTYMYISRHTFNVYPPEPCQGEHVCLCDMLVLQ